MKEEDLIARLEAFAIVSKMDDFSDAAAALVTKNERIAELEADLKAHAALLDLYGKQLWDLHTTTTAEIKKLNNENAYLERILNERR